MKYKGIQYDSRKVEEGDVFVAVPGMKVDGAKFIPDAVKKGARLIITQKDVKVPPGVEKKIVPSARKALAELSTEFYGHPAKKLKLIGITGTNGKTTTAYLIESILTTAGYKVGVIGTVGAKIAGKEIETKLTTPESLELQQLLAQMVKEGVTHVIMEVSSHSLALERVHGLEFDAAIFTNLTHDHLDFHNTFEEYLEAKKKLFKMISQNGVAIINSDDPHSDAILESVEGEAITYGIMQTKHELRSPKSTGTDVHLNMIDITANKMQLKLNNSDVRTSLIGTFNAYNILAAYQTGLFLNIIPRTIAKGINNLKSIPGRFEKIDCGQNFHVIVDFAHSPDALQKLLETVNSIKEKKAKTILVFGCPGDRDKDKRPIMGKIASELADQVIVTTDDPHSEDPKKIIAQIVKGIRVGKEIDRKKAIQKALKKAKKNDWVIIAGRGHEKFQDFKGKKVEIDDREVVRETLRKKS